MSTKLFGFALSLFSLARCFLVATYYLSMSVIIYHGGNACFSKRQHWKRWPKLFLRPCPMLLWWLECSLCISIGRVWTTLVHKASAVPDMSMWRGLHMIATWKMASEQLGNKCYQYRMCHTCCFEEQWETTGKQQKSETLKLLDAARIRMLTCSWSTATRKRPRNRQMLIRTLCHSYTTRWRAKSTSPGRLSRKFWSQHPSCLSHFVSFAKTTAPPGTAQRFPSALQPKSQCLTPWWVWYLLTLDRFANYHPIYAWSNLVIVSFDKSTCGPPARCSWQHPSPPDPPVASDSQKRKNQHGGVQKTGDESYKGLCDTCVNMYVCIWIYIHKNVYVYYIYICILFYY